jgi:hypothetical protein
VETLEKLLADADDGALLLIRRGETTVFVSLPPPSKD